MYDLRNFISYDGEIKHGEQVVLVWSKKSGFYFTQFGFIALETDIKIVAKEDI